MIKLISLFLHFDCYYLFSITCSRIPKYPDPSCHHPTQTCKCLPYTRSPTCPCGDNKEPRHVSPLCCTCENLFWIDCTVKKERRCPISDLKFRHSLHYLYHLSKHC